MSPIKEIKLVRTKEKQKIDNSLKKHYFYQKIFTLF